MGCSTDLGLGQRYQSPGPICNGGIKLFIAYRLNATRYIYHDIRPHISEFPFMHSCVYLTHKNLKGRLLFHASASQGRMEACSFYKLHDNLSA